MQQQRNHMVFQCYGHEGIFYECTYALLSLARLYDNGAPANTDIWIYTDNPEWFRSLNSPLPLHFREVDSALIKQWRGKIDFVHRVKIEVLKDFMQQHTGNVLYADTDIVFTQPIDKMLQGINDGNCYMHLMEGIVSDAGNPVLKKLNNYLRKADKKLNGLPLWDMAMWNAGVLGFNSSYIGLIDDVLQFTDTVHTEFPKHVVEQFAFSVYLGQTGKLKTAHSYILHYWNMKEVREVLRSFFAFMKGRPWADLVHYSQAIQMHVYMQDKISFLANRTLAGKIKKEQWVPVIPDWEMWMKQL